MDCFNNVSLQLANDKIFVSGQCVSSFWELRNVPNDIISFGPGLENIFNCVNSDQELKNTPVIAKVQMEDTCIPRQPLENSLIKIQCTLSLTFLIISHQRTLVLLQILVPAIKTECAKIYQVCVNCTYKIFLGKGQLWKCFQRM